jgi:hypothetical protein
MYNIIIVHYRTLSYIIEHYRTLSYIIKHYRTLSNIIEHVFFFMLYKVLLLHHKKIVTFKNKKK